jgi:uncharacterized protein (TIGR02271 family)
MDPRADTRLPDPDHLEVVRSEEELAVATRVVARERVRVVKRIVSETVTRTFEVRREELHVERVPLDGTELVDGPVTAEDVADIVLWQEELEVTSRLVPRERVRVRRELVTEAVPVADTVRREEIAVEEGAVPPGR